MQSLLSLFKLAANECQTNTGPFPSLYQGITCRADPSGVFHPEIGSLEDLLKIGGNVVRILMAFSGGIAVIVIIIAALYYITSNGDPARIKRAKEILINTTIGLGLIIGAYAIVTFIAGGF